MNIHPLWILCLITRTCMLLLSGYLARSNHNNIRVLLSLVLFLMGSGFVYKYLTGSNDEIQVTKVFWHKTRLVHGILYMLASYYLHRKNGVICMIILGLDIIFSILYRVFTDQ